MSRASRKSRSLNCILFVIFAFLFVFTCFPSAVWAVQVTLAWNENTEPDLAGYRIFCRQAGQNYDYGNPAWEGTDNTCTIVDLDYDTFYYFVARAVDTSDNESANSEEISYRTAPNEDPTADAGSDQTADEGDTVILDGSYSSDPENGLVSYLWEQTAGPQVSLSNPSQAETTFTAPSIDSAESMLTFRLTVTDSGGLQADDTCNVNIISSSYTPLEVSLDAEPAKWQIAGDTVLFSASVEPAGSYRYRFYLKQGTGDWVLQRAYELGNNQWLWQTPDAPGKYTIRVDVKSEFSTVWREAAARLRYAVTIPAESVTLQADPEKRQPAGASVVFNAAVESEGNYWYRFYLKQGDGDWVLQRSYELGNNQWLWQTPDAPGAYKIRVDVKSEYSTLSREAAARMPYTLE